MESLDLSNGKKYWSQDLITKNNEIIKNKETYLIVNKDNLEISDNQCSVENNTILILLGNYGENEGISEFIRWLPFLVHILGIGMIPMGIINLYGYIRKRKYQ